ncbi:TetR/AcrR family transcriptional regulator [Gandjariella thermophila]|uniref:TetR family transcriptional regulator n=1 Tax=Gandjariella thermophila TaxID=1931992 RepID=A0A4D4J153_9PSEU|nr:TetR/AcrR family transcriptional regulator [Gandjariella thermophila]GDY28379.1 TetR family transcriptional regulator [Gandjariella thermophila]
MSFPPRYRTAGDRARSRGGASGAQSRARAVQAALELFATSGFRGTSVAAVAEKTGLSQSGLLHHFPSKAALLSAVLEARDAEDGEFLASADGTPPLGWAAFEALAALVARNSTRPHLVGLFVRVTAEAVEPDHPGHAWVRRHYAGVENWLTEAVRAGQERGEIRRDAPVDALVRTTIAVMDGLQQQWLLDPERVSMVAEFSAFVDTLRARWGARQVPAQPAAT